jgi:hypothetical protein
MTLPARPTVFVIGAIDTFLGGSWPAGAGRVSRVEP